MIWYERFLLVCGAFYLVELVYDGWDCFKSIKRRPASPRPCLAKWAFKVGLLLLLLVYLAY